MDRLGIFVDAGYLFAQGSAAVTGSEVKRGGLSLNVQAVVAQMMETAAKLSGGTPLLRIYWYDAVGSNGLTLEQKKLASSDNVKVRMGTLNGSGQQKGVDSMIVIDMIELARNHAIADAVLISGDEDVRVGVQFAQNYGVRAHLIGITRKDGKTNQAPSLIYEADTHTEWSAEVINSFLSIRTQPEAVAPQEPVAQVISSDVKNEAPDFSQEAVVVLAEVAASIVKSLVPSDLNAVQDYIKQKSSVPREFDGKLLGMSRDAIARDLTQQEKSYVRKRFRELVKGD